MVKKKSKSVDPDQTAPKEQSNQGLHFSIQILRVNTVSTLLIPKCCPISKQ